MFGEKTKVKYSNYDEETGKNLSLSLSPEPKTPLSIKAKLVEEEARLIISTQRSGETIGAKQKQSSYIAGLISFQKFVV